MLRAWIDTFRKFSNYSDAFDSSYDDFISLFSWMCLIDLTETKRNFTFHRSFKVSSRQIISAWSPLATGIMSKLWCHPVHAERVYVREILSRVSLESINPSVDICTENWIRYGESWPEISSIEIPSGKARQKFSRYGASTREGSDIMITWVFTLTDGNRAGTDVYARVTAVGYPFVFPLAERSKQVWQIYRY